MAVVVGTNSYLSSEDADSYFDERVASDAWTEAGDADKGKALISATRRLDQQEWKGLKATQAQLLEWPRYDTYDRSGYYYASDAIPTPVQHATAELALVLIESPELLSDTGLEGFESISSGDLSITPRNSRPAGTLPAHVRRFISHLLQGGAGVTRLVRG